MARRTSQARERWWCFRPVSRIATGTAAPRRPFTWRSIRPCRRKTSRSRGRSKHVPDGLRARAMPGAPRNRLRELVDDKPSALGAFITLGDPAAVELAGLAGFDFVIIECEHAGLSLETVQNHLRAARARELGTLVRVPAGDDGFVQRVLDIGADGVLVPHISDSEAAAGAVSGVRFPPDGHRGMYPSSAAANFGAHS